MTNELERENPNQHKNTGMEWNGMDGSVRWMIDGWMDGKMLYASLKKTNTDDKTYKDGKKRTTK